MHDNFKVRFIILTRYPIATAEVGNFADAFILAVRQAWPEIGDSFDVFVGTSPDIQSERTLLCYIAPRIPMRCELGVVSRLEEELNKRPEFSGKYQTHVIWQSRTEA